MRLKLSRRFERNKGNVSSLSNGKGFHRKKLPQEEASWEHEEHMDNAKEAIKDFYKRNPMVTCQNIPLPSPPTSPSSSSSPWSLPFPTPTSALPLYTPHPWLYGWDNKAFHEEYLRKLEHNRQCWKSAHEEAYTTE